jgi:hypothetical protein
MTSGVTATTESGGDMDVRTNSQYLEFLAKRLDEFSRTFEEFMTHHVENSGFGAMAVGIAPAVLPKDSADKARVRGDADGARVADVLVEDRMSLAEDR